MSILKLLPLMYLVVKASATWLPRSIHQNQKYPFVNIDECLCATASPTIIDKLDNDHSGVERLVIFIYRKPNTGKIIGFIPETRYQRKIPDFPDNFGHINDIDQNLSIKEIYDQSPSKHLREHQPHELDVSHHVSNGDEMPINLYENDYEEYVTNTKFPKWKVPVDDETSQIKIKPGLFDMNIKIPKWKIPIDNETPVNKISSKQDLFTKIKDFFNILKIPKSQIPVDGEISVDNVNGEQNIFANMKIPQWQMPVDGDPSLNQGPFEEDFITGMKIPKWKIPFHNESPINKETHDQDFIENIKIPKWQIPVDGETSVDQVISKEDFVTNMKIPKWQMPVDGERPIIYEQDFIKNMKIPKWQIPVDGETSQDEFITEEQFVTNMNTPKWQIPVDGETPIKYKQDFIKNMKIPKWQITDGGKTPIAYEQDFIKNMKIPKWQIPVDSETSQDDLITEQQFVTNMMIPKWQIPIGDQVTSEEDFVTNMKIQEWPTTIDDEITENYVNPEQHFVIDEQINPQYISEDKDQKKTNIIIENIHNTSEDKRQHGTIKTPGFQEEYSYYSTDYSLDSQGMSEENIPGYAIQGETDFPTHGEQMISEAENSQVLDSHGNVYPMIKNIKVPRKDKHGRIIGWIIKKYWINDPSTHNNWMRYQENRYNPHYNHLKIDREMDPVFDAWLKEQLRITTLNGNKIPTSPADIIALNTAIRNILLQSGWIVTKRGILRNENGKKSNLNNLKLRPILVGKSFSYDNFIEQSEHKFEMSTRRPYLEGLLLTMINPPKILGIVPLSVTSETRSHHRGIHGGGKSIKGEGTMKILPIEELVSFRKDSKKKKDAEHLRNALKEIQQPQYEKGSLETIPQRRGVYYPGFNPHWGIQYRAGSLGTMPQQRGVYQSDFDPHSTHTQYEKGPVQTIPQQTGIYYPGFDPHRDIDGEERPDWRIIGGDSATGSGTPLDLKGRSGLNG